MKIVWIMKKKDFENYRRHQHDDYGDDGCCEGEYIGAVRVGNLCFDILNWGNHLWFDLYVGGVDTGYGYSERKKYKGYPYDFCDECSFKWEMELKDTSFQKFKEELSSFIEKHILNHKEYVTDRRAISVSLIDKANQPLTVW